MTKRKKSLKDWDKLDGFQKALEDFNPKESTPANNATPFHSLLQAQKQHCGPAAESSRAYNKTSKTAAAPKNHANTILKKGEAWRSRKNE